MELRRLNKNGLERFEAYLEQARTDPKTPIPEGILTDPRFSADLPQAINAEESTFTSRMEFVEWLDCAARQAGADISTTDVGFWSWLTLALFDQICPATTRGRQVREIARYIPQLQIYTRRYRHVPLTSWKVFQMHRDDPRRAALILNIPLDTLGELTEQFASRQEIISCPGTMALASRLFIDPTTGTAKKGAGGLAGRRFGKLLNQYQRTWDITVMEPSQSAAILPREFDRFLGTTRTVD